MSLDVDTLLGLPAAFFGAIWSVLWTIIDALTLGLL
jgi:hypothetical protein